MTDGATTSDAHTLPVSKVVELDKLAWASLRLDHASLSSL